MRSERDVELALRLPVLVSIPVIEYDAKAAKKYSSSLKPGRPAASTRAGA